MIWTRIKGEMLAACDENLLGSVLKKDGLEVELKHSFYGEKLIEEEEFRKVLKEKGNINLFGKNAIRIAKDEGLIQTVGNIGNVPYAIIIKM